MFSDNEGKIRKEKVCGKIINPHRTSPYKLAVPILKHGPNKSSEMLMRIHQENARKLSFS